MQKPEEEIKVTAGKSATPYISRAAALLLKSQTEQGGNNLNSVTFKASGQAIHTALTASDVIKKKIPGLHQVSRITKVEVKQTGKDNQEYTRNLVVFEITLTRNPTQAELKDPGYQVPSNTSTGDVKLDEILSKPKGRPNNNNNNNNNNYNRNNNNNRYNNNNNRYNNNNNNGVRRYNNNNNNNNYNNQNRDGERQQRPQQGRQQNGARRENYNSQRHYNNNGNNNQQGGSRRQYNNNGNNNQQRGGQGRKPSN